MERSCDWTWKEVADAAKPHLTETQITLLTMTYRDGWDSILIATSFGLPIESVRRKLKRAEDALLNALLMDYPRYLEMLQSVNQAIRFSRNKMAMKSDPKMQTDKELRCGIVGAADVVMSKVVDYL